MSGESIALTDRQKEVLTLIADGLSNKEIARALFIETKTVEVHAATVKKKLKGRNRAHVAVLAIRLGLVA